MTVHATVSRVFLGVVAVLTFSASRVMAAESVTLKNGQTIVADRVAINKDDTLTLFRKRMGLAKSNPNYRPPPDVVRRKNNGDRVLVWRKDTTSAPAPLKADEEEEVIARLSWTELSAISLQRYFPNRWNALQKQALSVAPTGATQPPLTPAIPIGSITASVNHPSKRICIQSLVFSRQGNDLLVEGVLLNLSNDDIFNVGALLHNADMTMSDKVVVAPKLPWGAKEEMKLRVPLSPDLDLQANPLLLDIRCFDKPASAKNRNDMLYSFKISRLASGEFTLTPAK